MFRSGLFAGAALALSAVAMPADAARVLYTLQSTAVTGGLSFVGISNSYAERTIAGTGCIIDNKSCTTKSQLDQSLVDGISGYSFITSSGDHFSNLVILGFPAPRETAGTFAERDFDGAGSLPNTKLTVRELADTDVVYVLQSTGLRGGLSFVAIGDGYAANTISNVSCMVAGASCFTNSQLTHGFLNGSSYSFITSTGNQFSDLIILGFPAPAETPGTFKALAFDEVSFLPNSTLTVIGPVAANPTVETAVPEPGTWITMIFGFGVAGMSLRRRRPHLSILS